MGRCALITCVVLPAERGEPLRAPAQDGGSDGHSLDISHCGGAAVEAHIGREGGLEPRHPLLALQALNQRRLLTCMAKRTKSTQS